MQHKENRDCRKTYSMLNAHQQDSSTPSQQPKSTHSQITAQAVTPSTSLTFSEPQAVRNKKTHSGASQNAGATELGMDGCNHWRSQKMPAG